MLTCRTDLAAEAHALWRENTGKTTSLPGVIARDDTLRGLPVHRVEILDDDGERALGKPRGTYLTLDIETASPGDRKRCARVTAAISALLRPLLPEEGCILVAGLGNAAMTPDALGPLTLRHLLITRHLSQVLPDFRPCAAIGAGVLGSTGMEAAEWIAGAVREVQPRGVILVDALAARSLDRLCTTIQIADTGLIPGSGIGNHRTALTKDTLGIPVISVGVPTVVDAQTLARDILRDNKTALAPRQTMFVTPDGIDARVRYLAKLIGLGITRALQPSLSFDDLTALTE